MKKLLFVLLLTLLLSFAVRAEEYVIYENNFSSTDLSAFEVHGNMQVQNGALTAVANGQTGEAYMLYTLSDEHKGKA